MKIPSYLYSNKFAAIYAIECHTNFVKRYIGSSKDPYNRLHRHNSKLNNNKHENQYLQNAWNKYGEDNFECYVIEFVDISNLNEEEANELLQKQEQKWINILNPEYNITKIVERNILSQESRKRISSTLKEGYKSGRIKSTCHKKVKAYDLDGNFIKEFKSCKEAGLELNCNGSSITRVLIGTYLQVKGYQFRYSENDNRPVEKVEKSRYLRRNQKPAPLKKSCELLGSPEEGNQQPRATEM
jgi:predicted GIY-YIG superfamily endonuclease